MTASRWYLPVLPLFLISFLSCTEAIVPYNGVILPDRSTEDPSMRIIALGDAGTGGLPANPLTEFPEGGYQQLVADDLASVSDPAGGGTALDFLLYLGDNFYENGVASTSDTLWYSAYRDVYNFDLLPLFYVVAGNHDYRARPLAQVDYSALDPTWEMPSLSYSFSYKLGDGTRIDFLAVDTNILVGRGREAESHWAWLGARLEELSGGNLIVFGHHTVFSAGNHGDTAILVRRLHPLMAAHGVDLYLCGHDHNLEVRDSVDGVNYIISGSGGKLRDITPETTSLYAGSVSGAVILDLDAGGIDVTVRNSTDGLDAYSTLLAWN